jgi:hypothetical protein
MRTCWIVALGLGALVACGGRDEVTIDAGPTAIDAPRSDAPAAIEPVSGWISVTESEGTFAGAYAYARLAAGGGTPGRFWLDRLTEVQRIGDCAYLESQPYACDPICPANWICVVGSGGNECRYDYGQDAGPISITGGAVPVEMEFVGYYGTVTGELPDDMFAAGDTLTASAPGRSVGAFSVAAQGVEPLDLVIPGGELTLIDGVDRTLTWTASPTPAQISFVIGDTYGHGGQPRHAIECVTPDTGSLTIPGALIERMPPLTAPNCQGLTCTMQVLRRFTSGTAPVGDGSVQLVVAHDLTFWVDH